MTECRRIARLAIIALLACGPAGCDDKNDQDVGTDPIEGDGDGDVVDAGHQVEPGDGDGDIGDGDGDDVPPRPDAGAMDDDAGTAPFDSGVSALDSGVVMVVDSGVTEVDSGTGGDGDGDDAGLTPDASVQVDAGPLADGGTSDVDAGSCPGPDPLLGVQGPNRTLGAVVLGPDDCDSPAAEVPTKLIDDNNGSKWLCRKSTTSLSIAFPAGATYAVDTYQITSGNDAPERDPKSWHLQGSNDGASWVTVDTRTNQGFTARGQTRSFYFSNCQAFARYRLVVDANNGDANLFQVAELRLYGAAGESLPTGRALGGIATSTCPNTANPAEDAPFAFDGSAASKWFCGGKAAVIATYDFRDEESYVITRYSITAANDSADRDPKKWVVEGSDDGITWTALEPAQEGQVFGERYQTNSYPLTNTTAYKQYRFNISENNGSVDFQVADFALFE